MRIVTHSQEFHADDVFAIGVMSIIHPGLEVVRTRDRKTIEDLSADPDTVAVVDVGFVYDHDSRRYDHHQSDFDSPLVHWHNDDSVDYASFGLIWHHYGKEAIRCLMPDLSTSEIEEVHHKINSTLVWSVDVWDYGYRPDPEFPWTTISSVISSFRVFSEALSFATDYVARIIKSTGQHVLDASEAEEVIRRALEEDPECRVFEFARPLPWMDSRSLRRCVEVDRDPAIAIYSVGGSYQIRPFKGYYFPTEWRAKNTEDLDRASGLSGTVFCHKSGFIGGAKDQESARKMAERALEVGLRRD